MKILILFLSIAVLCKGQDDLDQDSIKGVIDEIWQRPGGGGETTPPKPVDPNAPTWITGDQGCICVLYHQCDPETNMTITTGETDGFGVIDIRFGQKKKCEHFLDVCCLPSEGFTPGGGGQQGGGQQGGGQQGGGQQGGGQQGGGQQGGGQQGGGQQGGGQQGGGQQGGGQQGGGQQGGGQQGGGQQGGGQQGGGQQGGGQQGGGQQGGGHQGGGVQKPLHVTCGQRNPKGVGFSIKGNENNEAEYAEFPWMVAILRSNFNYNDNNVENNLAICGGSMIDKNVVLTGAHCVDKYQPHEIKIRAGEWDTQTAREQYPYQERKVRQIIVHERFQPKTVYNDIALLVLESPIEWAPNVKPVCLPHQGQKFQQHECYVTGWGKKVFGKVGHLSVILKKIDLPMIEHRTCERQLQNTRLGKHFRLHNSFVCAGGVANKDACTGDGGGPLVCPDPRAENRYEQAGIVAWGIGCGQENVPGVYADVATFRQWIDSHMNSLGFGVSAYTT